MTNTQEITPEVYHLSNLINRNQEAAKGYETASQNVNARGIKKFMLQKSETRKKFGETLESLLPAEYSDLERNTSFLSTLHRTWMDTKILFTSNNATAMLEECIRGESYMLNEYQEALEKGLVPDLSREVLIQQMYEVTKTRQELEKIKAALSE